MTPWGDRQILRVMPPQANDIRGTSFAGALDGLLAHSALANMQVRQAQTCPSVALPALVAEMALERFVEPGMNDEDLRHYIAAAWLLHEGCGYIAGMKLHLNLLGYGECEIIEGRKTMVGGDWVVGNALAPGATGIDMSVGGAEHWAEYWLIVRAAITPAEAASISSRLIEVAPAHCQLTRIICDAITTVVGGDWLVGADNAPVGATYPMELTDGISA